MPEKPSRKIRQAFILGAGLGTRLRPVTDSIPKVMVPIAPGKPLLEHQIELLSQQGIKDFVINLHYLPEAITSYFGDGKKWGVRIRYSDESAQALETGGALKKAEALLDDDFLFIYGDQLFFFDFKALIDFHVMHNGFGTIVLKTSDVPENGDILEFDLLTKKIIRSLPRPHGVIEFTETCKLNSGIFALSRKVLEYIPKEIPIKFDGEIVPRILAAGGTFYALPSEEHILDIGTPEKYLFAMEVYSQYLQRLNP
jgi:mannose-1-phosphate guanylyltransferase/phosphomannomutase